jgi:ribose transport system substrate-binding protein
MKGFKKGILTLIVVLIAGLTFSLGYAIAAEKELVEERKPVLVDTSLYKKNPPFTIGFDIYWLGNSWSVQFAEEFKYEASLHQALIKDIIITDSKGEVAKQVNNIEDLIARNVDIIVVTPLSESALIPVFKKAKSKGIPVVSNGIFLKSPEAKELVVSEVNAKDFEFGKIIAEWLVKKLNGKGKIIALLGLAGVETAELRWEGAMSVFKNYPDITVLAREYADWSYPKGKSVMASLLPAYPEIDGVWSDGAATASGALEAFEEAGRPLVPITGEDNNGFFKLWLARKDKFDSIGASKPTYIGSDACRLALQILQGEPVYDINIVAVPIITGEELQKYARPDLPDSFWLRTRLPESKIQEIFKQ